VVAQCLLAPSSGVGRVLSSAAQSQGDDRLLSLAPPEFSPSTTQGVQNAHLAVTVHNFGGTPLAVSASDFLISAEGDIFGARGWNGGSGPTTIEPGHSRIFRLSFALPNDATQQAALFYRQARPALPGTVPLEESVDLSQSGSSASSTQASTGTHAAAVSSTQQTINTFGASGGVGEPWGTAIDGAGNVWFAEPGCDFAPTCPSNTAPGQIGELNASTHMFVFFTLPNVSGNQPIFLAFDGSGNLWFTTPDNSMIGEFNPSTGQFVGQWPVTPGSGPWDLLVAGGKIWYTEHLASAVGSFDPSTHTFRDFQTPSANANPYGIAANGELIWFTENNSNVDRIAVLETANSNTILEYPIIVPPPGNTPHLVTIDPRGNPWWTEGWSKGFATLNRAAATPGECGVKSGTCNGIQRFLAPTSTTCSSGSHTSGIAFQGATGEVWFDNSETSQIGQFVTSSNTFTMTTLGNCGAHPHDGLNLDGAGNVWFDEEFANALGELIPAPVAPTTVTRAASAVAQTTATLNATVNPNGSEVSECKLEYGKTTSYGSSAPCTPAPGSGSSAVAVSATVSSLSANTTYHFRVSATNAGGTSAGEDETLKTLPNAPTVKT